MNDRLRNLNDYSDDAIIAGVNRSLAALALVQLRKREEAKIQQTIELIRWLNPDGRIKLPARPTPTLDDYTVHDEDY
jgi:hypothetical protein